MNTKPSDSNPDAQWIHCESALLPDGWAHQVAIGIDAAGNIQEVRTGGGASAPGTSMRHVSGCIVPGMANLHSHAHQRAMAGLTERAAPGEDSFWTWRDVMYRYVRKLQPHHLQAIAAQAYLEMLQSGYTAVGEFQYVHHDVDGKAYSQRAEMSLRTLQAARETGIGFTALPVLYRYGGFGAQDPDPGQQRFLNNCDEFLELHSQIDNALEANGNEALGIAPHSLRAVSAELLNEVLQGLGGPSGRPVHIHIAEQLAEVEACMAWSGQRPVEWLLDHFALDSRWCLIHATHLANNEVGDLAQSQAIAGLCPTTEANLGDGIFQMRAFVAAGGRFGIGSDCHISISPVEELRWLEYGQRLISHRRNALAEAGQSSGRFLFDGALAGGALACGRALGRIAVGCRADFVVLDNQHPLLYGRQEDELLDSWIFSGNASSIREVIVGGQTRVSDGRHHDAQRITGRYREVIAQLVSSDS